MIANIITLLAMTSHVLVVGNIVSVQSTTAVIQSIYAP